MWSLAGCDCGGGTTGSDDAGPGTPLDANIDASRLDAASMDAFALDAGPPDAQVDGGCSGTVCSDVCVDLETDPRHCGGCDVDCTELPHVDGSTITCEAGACVVTGACDENWASCDDLVDNGCETDLTQTTDCGACGTVCSGGTPFCGVSSAASGSLACVSGCTDPMIRCDMRCVDPAIDPYHCGGCDTTCPDPGHGLPVCIEGGCSTPTCDTGYHACGSSCLPDDAVESCGSSCTPCETPPHATPTCTSGACGFECIAPYADCDGNAANGCEVDTTTSAANCGGCGNVCRTDHGTAACIDSMCALGVCDAGWADCNGLLSDGCEISTDTNPANCGACGSVCILPNAASICVGAGCSVGLCSTGYADCDGAAANGCETHTAIDPTSCGACGNVCALPNAVAGCAAGGCTVAACNPGWGDCDGNAANGCEVDLTSSYGNCGTCGNVCTTANGTGTCAGGSCAVAGCNFGFSDCNGLASDGCETNIYTSVGNCGACGNACFIANGVGMCSGGGCQVASCNAGWGNCDGNPTNGCETNTTSDGNNCGSCGVSCASSCTGGVTGTMCSSGACQITGCSAGRSNIDGTCSNGCECIASTTGSVCSAPTGLGTLNISQSTIYTGNLPQAGQEAWLTVTFTGNTSTSYHPHVRLTGGAGEFIFDVFSSCSGTAMSCGTEGGSSSGVTDWEVLYTAGDPSNPLGLFQPVPAVGTSGTIFIRVRRASGSPTCTNYSLTVSN